MTVTFPDELKSLPYWGYCKIRIEKSGKKTKLPCEANKKQCAQVSGVMTFDKLPQPLPAGMYYRFSLGGKSKDGTVLQPPEIIILDYDKVIDENGKFVSVELENEINSLIQLGYVEKSFSGNGFHAILRKPTDWNEDDNIISGNKQPEIFSTDKYVLLTGNICNPDKNNIIENNELLYSILKRQKKEPEQQQQISQAEIPLETEITPEEARKFSQGLKRIKSSRLWNGIIPEKFTGDRSRAAESLLYSLARVVSSKEEMIRYFLASPFFAKQYGSNPEQEWHPAKANASYDKAWANRFVTEPTSAPKAKHTDSTELSPEEEKYNSQMGLTSIIREMKDLLLYDEKGRQWFIRDNDNYCFKQSADNGYSRVSQLIFKDIANYTQKTQRFCTKQNISASIDLARDYLAGVPTDTAYVFDGGKTVYIYQDLEQKWHVEERDSPKGLRSTLRVRGEYWKGSLAECPEDFRNWLGAYGTPEFVNALITIFSRALIARPDKICFELVSESGNTGKSTLVNCLCGAWGDRAFTRIESKEIMKNLNHSGRRTALLQAISKPFTILNEAEGKIDEGTFKEVVDTTETFSGNYCGRDRVEVTRRSCIFIESNKLIRANNTSAYANRAYPIEFTREFPNNDLIEDKSKGAVWQKYARGIMLTTLDNVVANLNAGKNIETQIAEICPALATQRNVLIQEQDYLQTVINSIIEHGADAKERVSIDGLWVRISDYATAVSKDITELGIKKDGQCSITRQARVRLGKELKRMGYETTKTSNMIGNQKQNILVVTDAKYI